MHTTNPPLPSSTTAQGSVTKLIVPPGFVSPPVIRTPAHTATQNRSRFVNSAARLPKHARASSATFFENASAHSRNGLETIGAPASA